MDREFLEKLREWVQEEVALGIADSQPGSDGYFGCGDKREADKLFENLCLHINQ